MQEGKLLTCCVQKKTYCYKYYEDQFVERQYMSKFDIQLRGCYLFRGMPFLRVMFIDVCKAVEFMNDSASREMIVRAKRMESTTYDPTAEIPILLSTGLITEPVSHLYLSMYSICQLHLIFTYFVCKVL